MVRLAVQGPEVIGFATAGPAEEVGVQVSFTLNAINVRRAYWGTGVGQRLLDLTVGDREAFLWVSVTMPELARSISATASDRMAPSAWSRFSGR